MTDGVIFDLDGTLIDSQLDLAASVNYARSVYGLEPLAAELVVSFIGNGVRELVRRAMPESGVDIDEATLVMKNYYQDHLVVHTVCYPGVAEGLMVLKKAGIRVGVATNKLEKPARGILERLDILKYVDKVIGGDSGFPLKPAPDSLIFMLNEWQVAPEHCWMVGDHYTDLAAGRGAKMKTAFAAYGIGATRGEKFDLQVDSFMDFIRFITT